MAFAPSKIMNGPKMQTKMSTWTPLNHQPTNDKVFEERGELLGKWVSWHWKDLAELDQLWMPKCLRLDWYINFSPTIYEQRIWKRHYIEMVKELNVTKPTTPPRDEFIVVDVHPLPKNPVDQKQLRIIAPRPLPGKARLELPPWRDSDRHPTDTIRFNYLDNCEPPGRKKGGRITPTLGQQARERKKHPSANYKMRKAKSLMSMSLDFSVNQKRQLRPLWARQSAVGDFSSKEEVKAQTQSSDWNAGIRPAPARPAIPTMSEKGQKATLRTQRSVPSCPLFESQPWQIPASNRDSDEAE
ncbi:F-box only protein 16 isoform X2 [Rhincodon typus]|uniref:F-box only protein 16 isoform X2 n=1 Tax=Rhincodon typus TaxID=259920 RepID=UPI00203024A7|nr:F-box only protein 16 isoform X2 [Rhincodon typus]